MAPVAPVNTPVYNHQQGIQLNVGTQGIGLEYHYGIVPKLALRGGVDVVPVAIKNVFEFSDFNSTSDLDARFTNIHILADYTPFTGAKWFRLVGGLAYFAKAKGTLDVKPTDSYKYGEIQLTPEQVGQVKFTADWQGVAPYAGLGFFRMFPQKKFNVNLDLGTYYLKQPKAHVSGTGSLQGNSSQTAQFQENIKDYRWLPVVQINFNYNL
ncbi:hypothetical protein GCM10027037_17510 [Mucilaginibacter koreensis]